MPLSTFRARFACVRDTSVVVAPQEPEVAVGKGRDLDAKVITPDVVLQPSGGGPRIDGHRMERHPAGDHASVLEDFAYREAGSSEKTRSGASLLIRFGDLLPAHGAGGQSPWASVSRASRTGPPRPVAGRRGEGVRHSSRCGKARRLPIPTRFSMLVTRCMG